MKLGDKLSMYYNEEVGRPTQRLRSAGSSRASAPCGAAVAQAVGRGEAPRSDWLGLTPCAAIRLAGPDTLRRIPRCAPRRSSSAGCCRARRRSGESSLRRRRKVRPRPSLAIQPARRRWRPRKAPPPPRRAARPPWRAAPASPRGMRPRAALARPRLPAAARPAAAAACWAGCAPRPRPLAAALPPCSSRPRACSRLRPPRRCGLGVQGCGGGAGPASWVTAAASPFRTATIGPAAGPGSCSSPAMLHSLLLLPASVASVSCLCRTCAAEPGGVPGRDGRGR